MPAIYQVQDDFLHTPSFMTFRGFFGANSSQPVFIPNEFNSLAFLTFEARMTNFEVS
jgi:hypothetical protein